MMNKDFVPYKESIELKELGFDEPCFAYFKDEEFQYPNPYEPFKNSEIKSWCITAPLYQQAFRFFREKYKIRFFIQSGMSDLGEFFKVIFPDGEQRAFSYENYEEAELACLVTLIKIVKQKQ